MCGGRGERFQVADGRGFCGGVGVGVGAVVVGLALGVLPGLACCLVQVVLGGVVGCVRVGLACCELRGLDVVEGLYYAEVC